MPGEHDTHYKLLFSHPRMVEDLINGFVPAPYPGTFRVRALERLDPSLFSDKGTLRISDVIWKIEGTLDVDQTSSVDLAYILLEVQSSLDVRMATRMASYTVLLRQAIEIKEKWRPPQKAPLIMPIVLYTGKDSWTTLTNLDAYPKPPVNHPRPEGRGLSG